MSKQNALNVVLCGSTSIYQGPIWNAISSDQQINVRGFWFPKRCSAQDKPPGYVTLSTDSFDELLRTDNLDVVLLCLPPTIQHHVMSSLTELKRPPGQRNRFPIILLIPPACHIFDTTALSNAKHFIGIAAPFRFLPSVYCLQTHLKSLTDNVPLHSVNLPSRLPSHWSLGTIRSIHCRLMARNLISPGCYSWLCELGPLGGGLLNIYGAGLIDAIFSLTGGLHIVSVSCLTRTYDTELCTEPKAIQRVSSDDYVVFIAELESRLTSQSSSAVKPVATFCLSSGLPLGHISSSVLDNQSIALSSLTDYFKLQIEITGSSGRFLLPEGGDRICWTPVQKILSSDFQSLCGRAAVNGDLPLAGEKSLNEMASNCSMGEEVVFLPPKISKRSDINPGSTPPVNGPESLLTESYNPVGEAWKTFFAQLPTAVSSPSPQHSLKSLVATPEHWDYIHKVIRALHQAARLRCWIHVGTGERL